MGGADAQEAVEQYRRLLGEVEALVAGEGALPDCSPPPPVVLPAVLHNLHDFFCHVAARLERLHDSVATLRQAFLAHRRQVRPPPPPFMCNFLPRMTEQSKLSSCQPWNLHLMFCSGTAAGHG